MVRTDSDYRLAINCVAPLAWESALATVALALQLDAQEEALAALAASGLVLASPACTEVRLAKATITVVIRSVFMVMNYLAHGCVEGKAEFREGLRN